MDDKNRNVLQNVFLENREKVSISGVLDVFSFDDQIIIIETELGLLTIKGENLKITATRELYEETGIKVTEEELVLIDTLSGEERKRMYPNGDIVYNNTSLYLVNINSKEINLNIDSESINLEFFDINNLPESMHDDDLINEYIKFLKK